MHKDLTKEWVSFLGNDRCLQKLSFFEEKGGSGV
jgi:hypothetical protein